MHSRSSTKLVVAHRSRRGEVQPPLGLLLAAVPVEQLGEQPARRAARRRASPGAAAAPTSASTHQLAFGELLGRLAVARHRAAGSGRTAPRPRRGALRASRAGRAWSGSRPRCRPRSRRASPGRASSSHCLVGDDAAAGVHHLARGTLHVELLDLLERVRLAADAHALAHDRVEVDEHARRAAARRPPSRGCRARP